MPEIALAPFDRILRKAGAERVGEDALEALRDVVEQIALEIAREAVIFAKHAGRKTVIADDVRLASRRYMSFR
ncbi:MAG: histone [Candidatus Methanomethylicota archaeon]|uniref:Histone n=1 Tax=Thermoproteota archaeon TaxID=2056631 RepID=A0A497ERI4_9CREN|nr:MAG: histone [Candidatus Verstraetearchaeota archaeon]RLE51581.1 MAG: histone [Candidatus Verstraetearchaeota archaeon]